MHNLLNHVADELRQQKSWPARFLLCIWMVGSEFSRNNVTHGSILSRIRGLGYWWWRKTLLGIISWQTLGPFIPVKDCLNCCSVSIPADKSVTAKYCFYLTVGLNLREMFPAPCWICAMKNYGCSTGKRRSGTNKFELIKWLVNINAFKKPSLKMSV